KVQGVETALRTGTLTTLRDTARATDTLTRAFKAAATPEDRQRFAALRVEVKRLERQLLSDGAAFDNFRDRATTAARVAREQFRRYRTSIRETTRAVRRDVVGVGRDLARGLIDETEANRRLAAIENRFQAYVRRVRALGEAAGVATKPLNREFARALQTVNREVAETERRASGLIAQLREQNSVVGRLSRNLRGALVGAYLAVGLVLTNTLQRAFGDVVRGAVAFDDALVDVGARTGLTGLQLARLGGDIRGLSRRLGLGATDLLAYAETAGQLGIQGRDNILAFVATAARLERVSDLSSDEAAESLAKIAAAFQLPITEAERYASAFNELGNVTAAQSGEIIDAVRRTGAAGRSFGLTVDQVAALNAVLIEAGIESRTAGTSVRNALTIIQTKADEVAETLGVTQAQFSALVQEDALGTLRRYLETLGELDSQARTIEIEAVFGRENLLSVETLATSTERLNAVLGVSASAYQEGTSLTREFDATLESVARQFEIFRARAGATAGVILARYIPGVEAALKAANRFLGGTAALTEEIGRLQTRIDDLESVSTLAGRYDELSAASARSEAEQAELETVTARLAQLYPRFAREVDGAAGGVEILTDRVRGLAAAQRDLLIREQGGLFRDLAFDAERLAVSLETAERRSAFFDEKQAEGGFTIYGDAATDAVALENLIRSINEQIGEQQTE
ncbi:MAG: phage tail tape measure protein, partial [Bacteroidota bacterium]